MLSILYVPERILILTIYKQLQLEYSEVPIKFFSVTVSETALVFFKLSLEMAIKQSLSKYR